MIKLMGAAGVVASIVVGAIVWFVLDVILNVAIWISFVAGGAVAIVGALFALGVLATHAARSSSDSGSSHRPLGAH